jgi:hypothetical protein
MVVNRGVVGGTDILVLEVLEQLQLTVRPLSEHRGAEGLHDLLDGDILAGELVLGRAAKKESFVRFAMPPSYFIFSFSSGGPVRTKPSQTLPYQRAGGRNI